MAPTPTSVANAGGSYNVATFKPGSVGQIQAVCLTDENGLPIFPSGSGGDLTNSTSTALEASRVVKATAGKVFVISGYSSADQYILVFDSASLPAEGTVPTLVIEATAGSTFGYTAPNLYGRTFSTGIVICNSSTAATKTIGGSTCLFDINYI
jgi:hypothetical protein